MEGAPAESASAELTAVDAAALPVAPARPRRRLRDRRGLRAAVRWTAVVLVFGALGAATAYGVTQPERTKIPGLRTPDDGRWTYPALKLPKLPEGAPRPMDGAHNPAARHYADPRTLLLPALAGAKLDTSFLDRAGWLPTADFVKVFQKTYRAELTRTLEQETLRHVAARAWTAQDGTRTEVYLLQFASQPYAFGVITDLEISGTPVQAGTTARDRHWDSDAVPDDQTVAVFEETAPRGPQHVRVAYVQAERHRGRGADDQGRDAAGRPVPPDRAAAVAAARLTGLCPARARCVGADLSASRPYRPTRLGKRPHRAADRPRLPEEHARERH